MITFINMIFSIFAIFSMLSLVGIFVLYIYIKDYPRAAFTFIVIVLAGFVLWEVGHLINAYQQACQA